MSNSKGPEVLASDPINQDTLKYPHRQEGNLQPVAETGLIRRFRGPNGQRLVLSGPVVNLARIDEQPAGLENPTPLQENFLDEVFNRMASRIRLGLTAAFGLGAAILPSAIAYAQEQTIDPATKCLPGQRMEFVSGNAALKAVLGDQMGEPVTCEHADSQGTGDVHQITTKGLGFWRKTTNTPTFTNGFDHWALTEGGLAHWTGDSIDPLGIMADNGEAGKYPDQSETTATMPGGGEPGVAIAMTNELLEAQIGRDPLAKDPQLESFFMQIKDLEQNPKLTPVRYKAIQNLKTIMMAKEINIWNPLGINPKEALEFARSNDKTIFRSFREWKSPDGQYSIIIATGPRPKGYIQGLGAVQGNIENLETALTKLYQLDPALFRNYPVNAISGFSSFFNELGYFGTFDIHIKTLFFTEVSDTNGPIDVWQLMYGILVEAWHMRYKGAPDKPKINLGIGKAAFSTNWITTHASSFPPDIVRMWKSWDRNLSSFYAANAGMGE